MFLYHHVPDNVEGNILYPLNEMTRVFPDVFNKQKAKYDAIKEKDVEIPGFGFWNDCINLMPVNPELVKEELEKFGHDTGWAWKFYKIDSTTLDNKNLIFLVQTDKEDASKRDFLKFTETNFNKYAHIGEVAKFRYQKAKDQGEQPYTFGGIPHVLYKGRINVNDLEIIEF